MPESELYLMISSEAFFERCSSQMKTNDIRVLFAYLFISLALVIKLAIVVD